MHANFCSPSLGYFLAFPMTLYFVFDNAFRVNNRFSHGSYIGDRKRASGGTPCIFSVANGWHESQSEGPKKDFDDFKASIQFVSNENDSIKSTMKVGQENVKELTNTLEVAETDMWDTVEDMLDKQSSS